MTFSALLLSLPIQVSGYECASKEPLQDLVDLSLLPFSTPKQIGHKIRSFSSPQISFKDFPNLTKRLTNIMLFYTYKEE